MSIPRIALVPTLSLGWLLAGCTPPQVEHSDTSPPAADTSTSQPADTSPPDPIDQDSDGVPEGEDCDDRDPSVYPGAPETWNNIDDDCDGVIDAEGSYTGSHALSASATYEGVVFSFQTDCAATLARTAGVLAFTITCHPDMTRTHADILLGEEVTVTVKESDQAVDGDRWEGRTVVASSNGWDTWGEGVAQWSALSQDPLSARITTTLDTFSLEMSGDGAVTR